MSESTDSLAPPGSPAKPRRRWTGYSQGGCASVKPMLANSDEHLFEIKWDLRQDKPGKGGMHMLGSMLKPFTETPQVNICPAKPSQQREASLASCPGNRKGEA